MNRKDRLLLAAVLAVLLSGVAALLASENLELDKAKTWFREGRIEEAQDVLERLVGTSTLSKRDRVEALEFLAFCNVAQQREAEVQTNFSQILRLDMNYEPQEDYLSHPVVMRAWLTARKQVNENYAFVTAPVGIKTIAVLDFDNNSFEDHDKLTHLGKGFADILLTDLANLTDLKVVERERIQFVLEEIERSEAMVAGKPLVDQQHAVRAGKLLGAQSILLGSYLKIGKKLRLDVRLVHTETSQIIKTDYIEGREDEILDLTKRLAIKISENLDVAVHKIEEQEEPIKEIRAEIPLDAAMAYSEALNYLDLERYAEARQMLSKALDLAPSFKMARDKLHLLQTFQKS